MAEKLYAQKDLVIEGRTIRRGEEIPEGLPEGRVAEGWVLGHFRRNPPPPVPKVAGGPAGAASGGSGGTKPG